MKKKYLNEYPELIKEWDGTKNIGIDPANVSYGSSKQYWWKCKSSHSWPASAKKRTGRGDNCPYCAGKLPSAENNLAYCCPDLASEFHNSKNGNMKPFDFTPKTDKMIWWQCKKCQYEWRASPNNRNKNNAGSGCPRCSGRVPSIGNNLLLLHPAIAKEWHPTKNGNKTPSDYKPVSGQKVWWKCSTCFEDFDQTIANRTSPLTRRGCPFCAKQKPTNTNNLKVLHPHLEEEWDYDKNKVYPEAILPFSNGKYHWLCRRRKHSYSATAANRVYGTDCPFCNSSTSKPELRLLSEFEFVFEEVSHRQKIHGFEIDIFCPRLNIGVEYDGSYYHRSSEKHDQDLLKNSTLRAKGITLFRLREKGLPKLSPSDVIMDSIAISPKHIALIFSSIIKSESTLPNKYLRTIKTYQENANGNRFINEARYFELLKKFPGPLPNQSLSELKPELAREWDYEKNNGLSPDDFTPKSNVKVYWICPKGHESWLESITARVNRKDPRCKVCITFERSLYHQAPQLAAQLCPKRNPGVDTKVLPHKSGEKYWWICPNDKRHVWEASVSNRSNGRGCPFCAGKKKLPLYIGRSLNSQPEAKKLLPKL